VPELLCAQPLLNATAAIAGGRPEKPQQVGAKRGTRRADARRFKIKLSRGRINDL